MRVCEVVWVCVCECECGCVCVRVCVRVCVWVCVRAHVDFQERRERIYSRCGSNSNNNNTIINV